MAGGGWGNPSDLNLRIPRSGRQNRKRLLFDRRYGWVFDEWKDPSEEGLAGGRGMFCIVSVAIGLLKLTSQSINFASVSVARVLENPDQISLQTLTANLKRKHQYILDFAKKYSVNLLAFWTDCSRLA